MPYVSKWISAIEAVAWVMRADHCSRADAVRQIEAAVQDGALRFVGRGAAHRWDWNGKVYRADLEKFWPLGITATGNSAPSAAADLQQHLAAAVDWHSQPLPAPGELQRITEALAELRGLIGQSIRARDADASAADRLEASLARAFDDMKQNLGASLARGAFAVFLNTQYGIERLPPGAYWSRADGQATSAAERIFLSGTASSNRHPGVGGTVMVRREDWQRFSESHLAERGLSVPAQQSGYPATIDRGGGGRKPDWRFWRHVPATTLVEAVALSLDIDPKKLRFGRNAWRGGRKFDEGAEFENRLELTRRCLGNSLAGPVNWLAVRYEDAHPAVELATFAAWALSVGFSIPSELAPLASRAADPRALVEAAETTTRSSEETPPPTAETSEPKTKGALPVRGGRRKGSGSIDDSERLRRMLHLLASGQAVSVHAAARAVLSLIAAPGHSQEADIARLRRKFSAGYGTEPPAGKTWADVAQELNTN